MLIGAPDPGANKVGDHSSRRPSVMRGVSAQGSSLRQALGFSIVRCAFHSRGSKS